MAVRVTIPEREVRRNFALNLFNGAVFNFASKLIDPPLILTWFVSQLTTSNLLIGMVAPLGQAGWFLPQIFISARIQRMERKMPGYTLGAVVRVVAWLFLAVLVWLVRDPFFLLVGFFTLYAIASVSAGLGGISFFDVVAKTIPARQRGRLFAWRQFLGGALGLGAGWIVNRILNYPALPFPRGHAVLIFLYCALIAPAMAAFIAIREPSGTALIEPVKIGEQLRRAGQLLRTDDVYLRYILARLAIGLASIALPFYGIYAKNVLNAPEGMVGIYVATGVGAQLCFNLPWGRLSDQHGNRLAMRLQSLGNGLTVLLALALVGLIELLEPQGSWLPYLALPLFFLDGAVRPAQMLTGNNFLLELVPDDNRPIYLGLSNTLTGVVTLASGLGGLVVDFFGFIGLFLFALALYLIVFAMASGLPEPRNAR